jgi:hypothetical protein
MRRTALLPLLIATALLAALVSVGAPPVSAQQFSTSCATTYIGPFAYYSDSNGWSCSGALGSGENGLGPLQSWDSWQVGDPSGTLFPFETCTWADSSAITWAIGIDNVSQSFSPTNWDVYTHDWASGVYYQSSTTQADTNIRWSMPTGSNGTCSASDPQGDSWGCTANVTYGTILVSDAYTFDFPCNPSPAGTPQNPYPQASYRGPTHAALRTRATATDLDVITRRFESRGTQRITCPVGFHVITADAALSNATVVNPTLPTADYTAQAATIRVPRIARRASVLAVVTCRDAAAGARADGSGRRFGSEGDDVVRSGKARERVYGGGGDDVVLVRHDGAIGSAGLGSDTVRVSATNGIGRGGPGDDALVGAAPGRMLLIGDSGHDTFTSVRGRVLINARDGAGGDTIVCGAAAHTRYIKDPGDVVRGTCRP